MFLENEKEIMNKEFVRQIIYKSLQKENKFIEILYDCYNKKESLFQLLTTTLDNVFLSLGQKDEFLLFFSTFKKHINALSRFKYLIKYKRARTYNTTDLFGDVFKKNFIVIFENNTKYVFQLRELMNIMNTALTNSCHFFSDPKSCKNPYTNIPFKKSSLYNIYFAIKESSFIMPLLIQQYFLSGFDITDFGEENEYIIRNHYLESYTNNITIDNVRELIKIMFHECKIDGCRIDLDFPKDRLLEIMRPYLQLYYKGKYTMLYSKQIQYMNELKYKLRDFMEFNPLFGRKKVIMKPSPFSFKKIKDKFIFNDAHIPFYENISVNDFMKSHLLNAPSQYIEVRFHNTQHHDDDDDDEDDDAEHDDDDTEDDDDDTEDDDDENVILQDEENYNHEEEEQEQEQEEQEEENDVTITV